MDEKMDRISMHYLGRPFDTLTEQERNVIHKMVERRRVSHNTNKAFENQLTFGQRLADKVASFGGSWPFIILFFVVLLSWIAINTIILGPKSRAFDPYPFILLNLVLSMLASIQAPIIMMSQNRQAAKDRMDAAHDYEVNLRAELEISELHHKLDELREKQWQELIRLQEQQLDIMRKLLEDQAH